MVREVKRKRFSKKIKEFTSSRFFIPFTILFVVIVSVFTIRLLTSGILDIRQRAATPKPTAVMSVSPETGNYGIGQQFVVSFGIDGGGQSFGAAQADVILSSNLQIESIIITPPESGGCQFTYNQRKTPSTSNPSFSGTILNGSSNNCTVYSLTLRVMASGNGYVSLSRAAVKSDKDRKDILLRTQSGSYTLTTNTQIIPTATPTEMPIYNATPTSLPTPTLTPTPTPKLVLP